MDRKIFAEKFAAARNQFIQELMDGCNDCAEDDLCGPHGRIASEAITSPKTCPEFQEFLRQMGLVKLLPVE
jgi:hypothetical protein